jgi:aminoglycoside phosphotransferase (APT) family kinase protein
VSGTKPPAEVAIDDALVRALIASQHGDLADLPITHAGSGWDNEIYRVGTDLAARLPRRALAVDLIAHEHQWLPVVASLITPLGISVPEPVRLGAADDTYPWPWMICRWVPGRVALGTPLASDDGVALARQIGELFARVHVKAPGDLPRNHVRGVPLEARAELVEQRLDTLSVSETIRSHWGTALSAPRHDGPAVWVLGDPHPGNLVLDDNHRLSGVIDFGDLTAGDSASDLAAAWLLFPDSPVARNTMRQMSGCDDACWTRARGWAIALATVILSASSDEPKMAAMAAAALDGLEQEPFD